jgi:hypothetical protein
MFQTCVDRLESYDGASLVVALGRVEPLPAVPRGRKLVFPAVNDQVVRVVGELDPGLLRHGVTLVVGGATYGKFKPWIDAVQRRLALVYAKYVLFPQRSDTIPDQLGLRGDSGFLLLREIAAKANFPLHLRYPLCDKLAGAGRGLPVTILAPGPSLGDTIPHLRRIFSHSLVICMARSLDFLQRAGYAPDFVVQLDTSQRMVHLLPRHHKLSGTYLVSLSLANIAPAIENFRGAFFMDSFDLRFLKNPHRLRESWLSGFIACLGLAECLGAPDVYLAGADHCWYETTESPLHYAAYAGGTEAPTPPFPPDRPSPVACSPGCLGFGKESQEFDEFELPDVAGHTARTYIHYFAIAAEAGEAAREIREKTGARFHTLFDRGILEPDVFATGGLDHLVSSQAPIDRMAVRTRIDQAQARREDIDLDGFIEAARRILPGALAEACRLEMALVTEDLAPILDSQVVISLRRAQCYRKFPATGTEWELGAVAASLLRDWAAKLRQAIVHARLEQQLRQRQDRKSVV